MAELVRGYGNQVQGAGVRIQRLVTHRETQAVGGFSIELDVVVQDRSGFVKARREFDMAVVPVIFMSMKEVGISFHESNDACNAARA